MAHPAALRQGKMVFSYTAPEEKVAALASTDKVLSVRIHKTDDGRALYFLINGARYLWRSQTDAITEDRIGRLCSRLTEANLEERWTAPFKRELQAIIEGRDQR